MKFIKFVKSGTYARVTGNRLFFRTLVDAANIHDFDEDNLKNDLCRALDDGGALKNISLRFVGQQSAADDVLVELEATFEPSLIDGGEIAVEAVVSDAVVASAALSGWSDVEVTHALDSLGTDYGPECVVALANGREIRTPAFPDECTYVRIVEFGFELAYWIDGEWSEDPSGVMGAIMGLAHGQA